MGYGWSLREWVGHVIVEISSGWDEGCGCQERWVGPERVSTYNVYMHVSALLHVAEYSAGLNEYACIVSALLHVVEYSAGLNEYACIVSALLHVIEYSAGLNEYACKYTLTCSRVQCRVK